MVWEQLVVMSVENPVIQAAEVAVIRSVAGFLENLCKGKTSISDWSWGKMFETIMRTFTQAMGLGAVGVPPAAAFATDYVLEKATKKKK